MCPLTQEGAVTVEPVAAFLFLPFLFVPASKGEGDGWPGTLALWFPVPMIADKSPARRRQFRKFSYCPPREKVL